MLKSFLFPNSSRGFASGLMLDSEFVICCKDSLTVIRASEETLRCVENNFNLIIIPLSSLTGQTQWLPFPCSVIAVLIFNLWGISKRWRLIKAHINEMSVYLPSSRSWIDYMSTVIEKTLVRAEKTTHCNFIISAVMWLCCLESLCCLRLNTWFHLWVIQPSHKVKQTHKRFTAEKTGLMYFNIDKTLLFWHFLKIE